jgi:MoaA/NifB/PqqE/SkfB family radical SAM enzyme
MLASGEVFASRHGRALVKAITNTYPDIKFNIVSNGVLFDEKNYNELGLNEKLNQVTISVHSATKSTYDKLIRNGDYYRLWKNIRWLNNLKKEQKMNNLDLVFTITHINYLEMAKFAKQAIDLGIEFKFFEYRKEEGEFAKLYDIAAVWLPNNKYHKKFLKVLKNPVFDSSLCYLSDNIQKLRNNCKKEPNSIFKFFVNGVKNVL